jgi:ABC-type glycerol-3-phosphate transport system permease component
MIPLYLLYSNLGWIDTYLPLTVPAYFGNAFFVFLVRQFFLTLPKELTEAAVIDGCSQFGTFRRIAIPLIKPAVVTVTLFTFMNVWNDFFSPLLYLNSVRKFTVALGLTAYQAEGFTHWEYLMAASTVAISPVLIVFLFFQRYFVEGLATTGLKG